jgi:hypothetical protein
MTRTPKKRRTSTTKKGPKSGTKKPAPKQAPQAKKEPAPKQATSTKKKPASTITGVEQVPDDKRDSELAEEWMRTIADPSLRYVHGVGASRWAAKSKWPWRIHVWVMEAVRDDELQVELRERIAAAIRAVRGATDVAEEDREVWAIAGAPSGEALVRAVAEVVDDLAPRTLAYVQRIR